jgi:hypothetical protein
MQRIKLAAERVLKSARGPGSAERKSESQGAKPLTNRPSGFEVKSLINRPSGFEVKPLTNHRPWF